MSSKLRSGTRLGATQLRFRFDGRDYVGQSGDTAASALLASGVRLLGRSMKYRRPRGLMAAGPEEPNALLTVGTRPLIVPNVPAPQLVLRDGMRLHSQNRWPSLRYDLSSLLQAGGGVFSAGFYYKTFIWPSWRRYETLIRNLAGLGPAPGAADIPVPRIEHLSCDVLVGGGGPAGIAAALAAARAGANVVLCEREPVLGGELDFERATVDGREASDWVAVSLAELAGHGARILAGTAIVGGSDGLVVAHTEPGGLAGKATVYKIRPRRFVIAMGAIERPIAFVDNDRPGVMLLGAAERLLARYGVAAGASAVLFGNHDRLYQAAQRFVAAGIRVRAIVDTRDAGTLERRPALAALRAGMMRAGVDCLVGSAVVAAHGRLEVNGASVARRAAPDERRRIECDLLLVTGGWSPAVHAGLHEGGVRRYAGASAAFVADGQPGWRATTGAARGILELGAVVKDGHAAGALAAQACGAGAAPGIAPVAVGDCEPALEAFWRSPARRAEEKRQFVDLQNDVTVADLRQVLAEGFIDIEHIKRYTALGMGTEQGRTSAVLGAAIVAELKGEELPGVGIARTRPPYHPMTLASLAGHRTGDQLRVLRRTPLYAWHASHRGVLESAGYWMRARYYRSNGGDATAAGIEEARRVRAHGGIVDGSTLGKIEVAGRDAAAYLDRLYLTKASTIKVGRSKYMINLREDGMVLDDGIVLRLAPDRFLATTSSAHAEHMLAHFEHYRDVEWSGREVALANVTEAWAVIVVAGPSSRATLGMVLGADWPARIGALTHMDFAAAPWQGRELRVLRASFSGELAFELHCRPASAVPLWEALAAAGLPPYGLEALDILRLEKGYLVSSELTGSTTPGDLGMDALVRLGNRCVGRDLLDRPAFQDPARPRLVGLRAADGKAVIVGGAQLTLDARATRPLGYVSSSAYSPAVGEWIALAFVARSVAEGAELIARDPLRGSNTAVRVAPPVHFDAGAERMKS
jgi:sarcosine oxidase subunit alpha